MSIKKADFKKLGARAKIAGIGLLIGLVLGIAGTIFFQNFNPEDDHEITASVVFERIVQKNELVSASQDYNITDKFSDANSFFGLFDIPLTWKSFWYRYVGTLKAGVNLDNAEYRQAGDTITVVFDQPYIISNTPNMEKSGVLEENNNVLNPIHIEDVDEFQRICMEMSQAEAIEGGLLEEAKSNAEEDIRNMFNAALGDQYAIQFEWREPQQ